MKRAQWHGGIGIRALVVGLAAFAALSLGACRRVKPDALAHAPSASRVGELICADGYCPESECDSASPHIDPFLPIAACPALVVASAAHGPDGKDTALRILGSFGLRGWVPASSVSSFGKARGGDSLLGATEGVYTGDWGMLGMRFPTRENPYLQAGLIFPGAPEPDTSPFLSAPALRESPALPEGEAACAEAARSAGGFGLVHAPLLPVEKCSVQAHGHWEVQDGPAKARGSTESPKASKASDGPKWSRDSTACSSVEMAYVRKQEKPGAPVFLAFGCGLWMFSEDTATRFLRFTSSTADTSMPREEDIMHVTGVEAVDLDADGRSEWVVETSRLYGDGSYRQLILLSFGKQAKELHTKVIGLSGSGGEEGSSTVEGAWWTAPGVGAKRIYIAKAGVGGEESESSHGVQAYQLGGDGSIRAVATQTFSWAFFGDAATLLEARKKTRAIASAHTGAEAEGLHPVPWRVGESLLWRVGIPVLDTASRRRFSSWPEFSGVEPAIP